MNELGPTIILQARMGSTRLPGKILKTVGDMPLIEYEIERLKQTKLSREIVVATTTLSQDDPVEALCNRLAVICFRGSEHDVLSRYYEAAKSIGAECIVRVTADCPLIDPEVIDYMIDRFQTGEFDYASNNLKQTYPHGLDAEIMTFSALEKAHLEDKDPATREHVSSYIRNNPEKFRCLNVANPEDPDGVRAYWQHRWTVDYLEDYILIEKILTSLYPKDPSFRWKDVCDLMQKNAEWKNINSRHVRH